MRAELAPHSEEQAHFKKGKPVPQATGPEPTRPLGRAQHKEPGYALNFSRRLSQDDESRFPIIHLRSNTPEECAESSRQITDYIRRELRHQWLDGRKKVKDLTFITHQLKLAKDLDPANKEVVHLLEDISHFHELIPPQALPKRSLS